MKQKNFELNPHLLSAIEDFKKQQIRDYEFFNVTDPDHVLIRFLKFVPPVSGNVLIPSMDGGFVKGLQHIHSRLTPICKVIKSGSDKFKEGDILVVADEKVSGELDNPAWQLYEQSLNSKGVEAIEPEDSRRKIPAIELMWSSYIFKRPWMYTPEDEDRITFLLPTYELKVSWDLEAYLKTLKKED